MWSELTVPTMWAKDELVSYCFNNVHQQRPRLIRVVQFQRKNATDRQTCSGPQGVSVHIRTWRTGTSCGQRHFQPTFRRNTRLLSSGIKMEEVFLRNVCIQPEEHAWQHLRRPLTLSCGNLTFYIMLRLLFHIRPISQTSLHSALHNAISCDNVVI